jgi:hypothetical protein
MKAIIETLTSRVLYLFNDDVDIVITESRMEAPIKALDIKSGTHSIVEDVTAPSIWFGGGVLKHEYGSLIPFDQVVYDDLLAEKVTAEREELVASMVVTRAEFAIASTVAGLVTAQEAEDWAGGTKLPAVITTALTAITDDTERLAARIQALTSESVHRNSPIIAMAQANLSLSDDQVDSLFNV